ncbi:MAG: ribosomal RNA small subunit methyltransferase A [Clostridia bacterium]|nr:ribosomal RNA small subunit methyltransferase A [Clostridia bacterium]
MAEYSNINFKKKFGQNFLSDKNLLASIVRDAGITSEDCVLEIGAGAGALTAELVKVAKKVIAFEIDTELKCGLESKFAGLDNIEIIFADFLNINEEFIYEKIGKDFKVVANLPYYITTPILTKLFSMVNRPKTISVMVQKEVGERVVASPKKGDYGYFSAYVSANADAKITRQVNRKMFTPPPNVDSCIVRLDTKENIYPEKFFEFLKSAFSMKRKTIKNNIEKICELSKQEIDNRLKEININPSVRADGLTLEELYSVYKALFE